jgi:hypothetical protein
MRAMCRYDPTQDTTVLCAASGGTGPAGSCVTQAQALAMNKIWYGQTVDGSVPSPAADNGFAIVPTGQRWYGLTRGTNVSGLAGASPFTISSDLVALELQNPSYATPSFINATGNGTDGWKALTYANLSAAADQGIALQSFFGNINTDDPDLSNFLLRGGKMQAYHGLSDTLIPPQGTVNYYNRVLDRLGGQAVVQRFYRLFLVPGMAHGFSNGTANPAANPPLPTIDQLYGALTAWVEDGQSPSRIDISSPASTSRPLCLYPEKAVLTGADPLAAASYTCG